MNFFNKVKNDSMDPLSCIIKLYILTFKNAGSKIAICNNRVNIDQAGYFQGTARLLFTNSVKTDITILTMPILYACNIYLKMNKTKYQFLFSNAIEGLKALKNTYEGVEITYTIDTLIGIISEFINSNSSVINTTYNTNAGKLKQIYYNNICQVWTDERLSILFSLIEQINSEKIHLSTLVATLETFMQFIDEKVHDIISGLT